MASRGSGDEGVHDMSSTGDTSEEAVDNHYEMARRRANRAHVVMLLQLDPRGEVEAA
jgi:hypothetical protein